MLNKEEAVDIPFFWEYKGREGRKNSGRIVYPFAVKNYPNLAALEE